MNFPVQTLHIGDADYPPALALLPDAPLTMYVRGVLPSQIATALAIVGTRKPTPYGSTITKQFATACSRAGLVVVSGLAIGIDALAHECALTQNASTVAVLGSGIDDQSIYPRTNLALARRILENGGALVSEQPPGTSPRSYHFPLRNRIIAGLSHGVLVTEGAHTSGSLITAKHALEYGREVFACPHPLTSSRGAGSNYLLACGAHVALSPETVLSTLGVAGTAQAALSPLEEHILTLCRHQSHGAASLACELALPQERVHLLLFELETKKRIVMHNGCVVVQ